ncbi:hypothetical protein HFO99_24355 [Rhizobium leguminosarum]|uniref:hypothetical protein n=1 Tax=Rhizobium leguminosarum TaxID=384 RepID=UPI001C987095|nr:hypothetical protein [Rhizobium leguminosarum]MBY5337006.1 hypothetical protein [Rhizobium leguminosarum]
MIYASRNWKATETSDFAGSKYNLTVSGDVEVRRSNQTTRQSEATPQGINPKTLILNLNVEGKGDVGGDVVEWRMVEFTKGISPRQYDHVTVTGETDEQTIEVEVILS